MAKLIPLTKNQHAIVDDEDYERLSQWKWHIAAGQYAARHSKEDRRYIYMHREILNAPDGVEIDHVNGNGLDNQRHNLRIATHQQNMQHKQSWKGGSSQYKGVYWAKRERRWAAEIIVDKKKIGLGYHRSEIAAAQAYNAAAQEHFGTFAWLNLITQGESND